LVVSIGRWIYGGSLSFGGFDRLNHRSRLWAAGTTSKRFKNLFDVRYAHGCKVRWLGVKWKVKFAEGVILFEIVTNVVKSKT
jgi:hypothetical protein